MRYLILLTLIAAAARGMLTTCETRIVKGVPVYALVVPVATPLTPAPETSAYTVASTNEEALTCMWNGTHVVSILRQDTPHDAPPPECQLWAESPWASLAEALDAEQLQDWIPCPTGPAQPYARLVILWRGTVFEVSSQQVSASSSSSSTPEDVLEHVCRKDDADDFLTAHLHALTVRDPATGKALDFYARPSIRAWSLAPMNCSDTQHIELVDRQGRILRRIQATLVDDAPPAFVGGVLPPSLAPAQCLEEAVQRAAQLGVSTRANVSAVDACDGTLPPSALHFRTIVGLRNDARCRHQATVTLEWRATDRCGHVTHQRQNLFVNDLTAPVWPPGALAPVCSVGPAALQPPQAYDTCDGPTVAHERVELSKDTCMWDLRSKPRCTAGAGTVDARHFVRTHVRWTARDSCDNRVEGERIEWTANDAATCTRLLAL